MTEIYLIRHADSVYTKDEFKRPLSSKGREEAEKLVALFNHISIDIMISSPYSRAFETIEPLRKNRHLEIVIEDSFKERKVATNSLEDFEAGMKKLWSEPSFNFEGGLSNLKAQKVGVSGLESILHNYKDKRIVIGTHGNIMTLIMQYYDHKYDYDFWKNLNMPAVYKLTFKGDCYIKSEAVKP